MAAMWIRCTDIRLTDANNHTTSYAYDGLNRVISMTDPLANVWTYSYDDNHNLTLVEQPNGQDLRYVYDEVNRLTGIDLLNDSTLDIQYAYDAASRRTSMTDATGTTSYSYDAADRLTSVTAPATGTLSYAYNQAGQRTSLTYPSNHQVSYGYTNRGELETVTDWLSGVTTYSYDPAGRLTGISYPNGVTGTIAYDNADRLTSLSYANGATPLETISYGLNAVGVRTSMTDGSGTISYDYDALYRLTEASYPNGDVIAYGYDAVGNRSSLTVNGSVTTNTYNAANELTTSGSDTYSYDANGNLTAKTVGGVTTSYSWDALNRLTGITGSTTASYASNGDGLRVGKTVSGVTTDYSWDPLGLGQVIADGDEYVRGHGLISQITSSNTAIYAHQDGLGSVRLLTDTSATIVGSEEYDAFGTSRGQSGVQLPFSYTGEQVDGESGLVYLRARYVDPATGRFLSRDPFAGRINNPATQHRYMYAGNNPANFADPLGLCGLGDPWNCPDDVVEWITDPFDWPPSPTQAIQIADMVPLGEVCALSFVPVAIAACEIAEIAIGTIAFAVTEVQILLGPCSWEIKIHLSLVNAVNLGLDTPFPMWAEELIEVGLYVIADHIQEERCRHICK